MSQIRRAILSVHDKRGIVELARFLTELDVELLSTAGTLQALHEAGINAISLSDYTGTAELLDGRVKTLHPKIHAGLLGIRSNKLHQEQMQAADYPWIDMVICDLHPVEQVIARQGITLEEVLEHIDIGGQAMIRAAAKNFRYVTVVVNPERYSTIMHELRAHEAEVTYTTRYRLAMEAFARTAHYEQVIHDYLLSAEPRDE
jgi:phosphoribosylaminoimidazolecarboxamide formyltransferase/IMP cyclohydrolase